MPHRKTFHEQVTEAADHVEKMARQDPHYHDDSQRDYIYEKAADPKSDWPEPPITSERVADMHLLPTQMPTSPGKKGLKAQPVTPPGAEHGDMVSGINRDVGQFQTGLQHGRHTGVARDAGVSS